MKKIRRILTIITILIVIQTETLFAMAGNTEPVVQTERIVASPTRVETTMAGSTKLVLCEVIHTQDGGSGVVVGNTYDANTRGCRDSEYPYWEKMVKTGQKPESSLMAQIEKYWYSQSVCEQFIKDGYLVSYVDRMKSEGWIPQDFTGTAAAPSTASSASAESKASTESKASIESKSSTTGKTQTKKTKKHKKVKVTADAASAVPLQAEESTAASAAAAETAQTEAVSANDMVSQNSEVSQNNAVSQNDTVSANVEKPVTTVTTENQPQAEQKQQSKSSQISNNREVMIFLGVLLSLAVIAAAIKIRKSR